MQRCQPPHKQLLHNYLENLHNSHFLRIVSGTSVRDTKKNGTYLFQ
jgi:hypothetical protein